MNVFLTYTVLGLVIGASYAIAASGLVLTYATTRIFNVAHGATAMVMAFVYWELAYNQGLANWLSVLIVVFGVAPLFGALLERWVIRRVADAGVGVTLVVTCAVLVGLIGAAEKIWPPGVHQVQQFFAGHGRHRRDGADHRERTADRRAGGGRRRRAVGVPDVHPARRGDARGGRRQGTAGAARRPAEPDVLDRLGHGLGAGGAGRDPAGLGATRAS